MLFLKILSHLPELKLLLCKDAGAHSYRQGKG
jgi:hypothetical protein